LIDLAIIEEVDPFLLLEVPVHHVQEVRTPEGQVVGIERIA